MLNSVDTQSLIHLVRRGGNLEVLDRMCAYDSDEIRTLKLRNLIQIHAHEGQLYLWESGMDCDCVSYGHVTQCEATLEDYLALEERIYMDAEGPFSISFMTYAEALEAKSYTRDLAMEAHENGHDHVVYY